MNLFLIKTGAILICIGVALGAFGAHALEDFLENAGRIDTYETATKYLFYHAIGMILCGMLFEYFKENLYLNAGLLMFVGVIIFSGSLYTLCMTGITWLGAITPLGGMSFIIAWLLVFVATTKVGGKRGGKK